MLRFLLTLLLIFQLAVTPALACLNTSQNQIVRLNNSADPADRARAWELAQSLHLTQALASAGDPVTSTVDGFLTGFLVQEFSDRSDVEAVLNANFDAAETEFIAEMESMREELGVGGAIAMLVLARGFVGSKGYRVFRGFRGANRTVQQLPDGSFSVSDWRGYPKGKGIPQPPKNTVFRLIEGDEYAAALKAKNAANRKYRKDNNIPNGYEVHEIVPVKFGGSPTDPANKYVLTSGYHRSVVSPWWARLKGSLQ